MAIVARIVKIPNPTEKIQMIKLLREAVVFDEVDPMTNRPKYLGLKDAKTIVDNVCANGEHEFEFPNKKSYEKTLAAGFTMDRVTGLADEKDEKGLQEVRAWLYDALDKNDVEAMEKLLPAFRLFVGRVKGV